MSAKNKKIIFFKVGNLKKFCVSSVDNLLKKEDR